MVLSELRLFLSVDIVGSTVLKGLYNHNVLLSKYESRESFLSDAQPIINSELQEADKRELLLCHLSDGCKDWQQIMQDIFDDFHTKFLKSLKDELRDTLSELTKYDDISIWKTLGDEIIYSIVIESREDLQIILSAFLYTIEICSSSEAKEKITGVKGTAWVAGFPVRNRVITLPNMAKDYLGPEMDIGFRLKACTWRGYVVACMNTVELLLQSQKSDSIIVKLVGWETLRGVWKGKPYPIFWIRHESQHNKVKSLCGETTESKYLKLWEDHADKSGCSKSKHKKIQREQLEQITAIRSALPQDLGEVAPYIYKQDKQRPPEHEKIMAIVNDLEKLPKTVDDHDNANVTLQNDYVRATKALIKKYR
jgi:hypothetical protein